MNKSPPLLFAFLFAFYFLALCPIHARAETSEEVRRAFRDYMEAAAQSQGDRVVSLLSESAAEYFDRRLQEAKTLPKSELMGRPSYQIFSVIWIRKKMSDDPRVAAMNGRQWLAHSYTQGWNSKIALRHLYQKRNQLEFLVELQGAQAELKIKDGDEIYSHSFPFIRERGSWKLDGARQFQRVEENIEAKRKAAGWEKTRFVEMSYQKATQESINESLWNPLKK